MSRFTSALAPSMEDFLDYREALGYSTRHFVSILANIDRFVSSKYADCGTLTKGIVMGWLESQRSDMAKKSSCIRRFGEYLNTVNPETYVLPRKITGVPKRKSSPPYLFNDNELYRLFASIDSFPGWNGEALAGPYLHRCFTECWRRANPTVALESLPSVRVYNLRHRFATTVLVKWLESGADLGAKLPYLRAYMGHETFDETLYYVHLLPENFVMASGVNWNELSAIVPEVVQW